MYATWCKSYAACKDRSELIDLCKRTHDGEFGSKVKFSVFGIGDFDPKYIDEVLDNDTLNNMLFYAKMFGDKHG
jgi:hypothetical protein